MTLSRRALLASTAALTGCFVDGPRGTVAGMELIPVRATARTVWLFVQLETDTGVTGLGEASDAFGFANTTKADAARMESELRKFFDLIQGRRPEEILRYRAAGREIARTRGLVSATAFSAVEQALWDIAGQILGVPIWSQLGGRLRDQLPVYANINRATQPRTPQGFAETARRAYEEGFRAMKAAPFDGFPPPGSARTTVRTAVDQGIAAMEAIRAAVGPDVQLMVDCHSFFDVPLAIEVAQRLEPLNLTWYEEPVAPERTVDTVAIHKAIRQPMAGGEVLFGVEGFLPLCTNRAVNVIMPDVKHCGGLLEMTHIAALAAPYGITVAPHNPSGPVSTAASVQICAGMQNFRIMEMQWGEVPWRAEMLDPPEQFVNGTIRIPDAPGLGVKLNAKTVAAHPI